MALEDDLDPRILREFISQVQDSGKITAELSDEIAQSSSSFAKFRKAGLQKAGDGLKALGGSSKDLATGLIEGKRGFDALNPAIDLAASAMKGLLGFIPGVSAATDLVVQGSKLMVDQIQKQVNGFQEIGEVGALGAKGLEGLQDQFIASGLTLESYTKALRNSSVALARFRGLTGDGAEDFSDIVGKLTQGGDLSLRRLGLSAEQLGESTEAFLSRQTRLGLSQRLSNQVLAQSTTTYIKELDMLSKVTGMNRKDIQNQQDAALSETRFRASIEGMRGTVEEGAINSIMNFQSTISGVDQQLGAGVRDLASGFTATEAARRAEFVTGGQASKIMDRLRRGQINELQAREQMQTALKENREQIIFAGRALGDTSGIIGNTAGLFDLMNLEIGKNGELIIKGRKIQQGQMDGSNELTNSAVAAQQSIEKMQIEMQKLFFLAMPKAAKTVEFFSGKLKEGIGAIYNRLTGTATDQQKKNIENLMPGGGSGDIFGFDPAQFKASATTKQSTTQPIQTFAEAQKNLLDANVIPHADIAKVAQYEGTGTARKVANAKDTDLVSSILGVDATLKYNAITIGDLKEKIANLDVSATSGPNQAYSSMTASLDPNLSQPETADPESVQQSRSMDEQVDLLKENNGKLDQLISHVATSNNINNKILGSSYA